MKRFLLLGLILIVVSALVPYSRTASAQQDTSQTVSAPASERCQTKIQRKGLAIKGVLQVRWNQRIYWCYDQTRITYWDLTTWEQVFSPNWAYRGPYTPIVRSGKTRAVFQTSALFKKEKGSPIIYWRPYVEQTITQTGTYKARYWFRRW